MKNRVWTWTFKTLSASIVRHVLADGIWLVQKTCILVEVTEGCWHCSSGGGQKEKIQRASEKGDHRHGSSTYHVFNLSC